MPPRNKKPEQRQSRRNFFVYVLIAILLFGVISTFMVTNFINVQSYPPKSLQDFEKDISEAVNSGSGNLPKFRSVVYNASTGKFLVERSFIFNGKAVSEHYSVLVLLAPLSPNPLTERINPNSPLTYLQAIFMKGAPALTSDGVFDIKVESRSWLESFFSLLPTILSILVPLAIYYFIFRGLFKGIGSGIGGSSPFGKTPAHKIISRVSFNDVAGCEEVKEEIAELVDYLRNPKRYSQVGARIPKGILLGGPPGTGKTLLAKAVAGEAKVPFYFISASGFVEVFVGLGAKRVRDIFSQARADSPSIVFIDELDAVGKSRSSSNISSDSERETTLNQLLVEMDGMVENSGVLVMAATNRHNVLDEALLRPGRFDRVISISLPDVREREAILALHAKGKRFSENVAFKNIAKRTPGFSGAQLENVINEASLLSVRERSQVITLPMIDEAIDRVMSGPAKKSRVTPRQALERVAYHEAGHAVVSISLNASYKVQKITIVPRGDAGGYNMLVPENESMLQNKEEILANIASLLGGRAAEEIILGEDKISSGSSDDIDKATKSAKAMVTL